MKYSLDYTLKKPVEGYPCRLKHFATKAEANSWLKKNKEKIYWFSLRETDPKSKLPLPIIEFVPGEDYEKNVGTLQTYFETGMECLGLIFYKDGVHSGPNPNFDPSKPEDKNNFRNFSSHDGIIFLEHGQILEFEDGKRIGLLRDPDFAKRDGYGLSFYPSGFSKKEWTDLFKDENVKVTIWTKKKETK